MPAGKIPAPLLGRVNELADVLGYIQVDAQWGTGARPADLRVDKDRSSRGQDGQPADGDQPQAADDTGRVSADHRSGSGRGDRTTDGEQAQAVEETGRVGLDAQPRAADSTPTAGHEAEPGQPPVTLPGWALTLDARVRSGLAGAGEEYASVHGARAKETVLLFMSAPAWTDADAWWRLDLAAGSVTAGLGHCPADAYWSLTGSAAAWERLLAGESNLGVAFRRGDLRYADKGDAGAGSIGADTRVAALTDVLGIARWVAAR